MVDAQCAGRISAPMSDSDGFATEKDYEDLSLHLQLEKRISLLEQRLADEEGYETLRQTDLSGDLARLEERIADLERRAQT